MNYSIVFDKSFEKEVKRLSKRYPSLKSDLIEFQEEIYANPRSGPISATAFVKSVCVSLPKDEAKAVGQGLSLLR